MNKITKILSQLTSPKQSKDAVSEGIVSSNPSYTVFDRVMNFRKNLQSNLNLLLNPLKRQVKSIQDPAIKQYSADINKQLQDLESLTKRYFEDVKRIEVKLYNIFDMTEPDNSLDYDSYDSGIDTNSI